MAKFKTLMIGSVSGLVIAVVVSHFVIPDKKVDDKTTNDTTTTQNDTTTTDQDTSTNQDTSTDQDTNSSVESTVKNSIALDGTTQPVEGIWIDGKWATERGSDYTVRKDIIRGRLKNGLRYIIMKHQNPKGSVSAWLDVQAGSLVERPKERGLMHLLEHMAFNGSKNFPAGSLIKFFQENGMTFGGDSNAFTDQMTTAYQLKLKSDKVGKGLDILSDFSGRALLSQTEIDSEREVVLHEKTLRDTPNFKLYEAYANNIYKGTKYKQMPIGSKKVVQTATKETLTNLYHAWYRPKNEIVMVVGDIDPAQIQKQIEDKFSDLQPVGEPRTLEYWNDFNTKGVHALYYKDKDTSPKVAITHMDHRTFFNDTKATQKSNILKSIASYIFQMRIQKQIEENKAPYLSVEYSDITQFTPLTEFVAEVSTKSDWKNILAYTHKKMAQAIKYGFTQQEFDNAKKAFNLQVQNNVEKEKTYDNVVLMNKLLTYTNTNVVPKDPQQLKDIYDDVFANATLEDLNANFKKSWANDNRYVTFTGNIDIDGGEQAITDEWNNLQSEEVEKPVIAQSDDQFPYLTTPDPVAKSGVQSKAGSNSEYAYKDIAFANGTVAHFKSTQNKKDQIIVSLNIGKGLSPYKGADYYKALVASRIYNASGIGKITPTEINNKFGGNEFSISAGASDNGLNIVLVTRKADLELAFQMLYTKIKDPQLMESAFDRYQTALKQALPLMDSTLESSEYHKAFTFVNGSNIPEPLTYEKTRDMKFTDIKDEMANLLQGSTSISVVGDVDEKTITNLLSKYVVSIPEINKNSEDKFKTTYRTYELSKGTTLDISSDEPSNKANVTMYIPIDGLEDNNLRSGATYTPRDKQMALTSYLANIIGDRLRSEIRERLQLTYSPSAGTNVNYNKPNYGYIALVIPTRVNETENVKKELLTIIDDIKTKGINDDEVELFKKPIKAAHSLIYQNNNFWVSAMQTIDYRKSNAMRTTEKDYDTIMKATADDMNKIAKSVLDTDNISFVVAKAKGVQSTESTDTTTPTTDNK